MCVLPDQDVSHVCPCRCMQEQALIEELLGGKGGGAVGALRAQPSAARSASMHRARFTDAIEVAENECASIHEGGGTEGDQFVGPKRRTPARKSLDLSSGGKVHITECGMRPWIC